MVGCTCLLFVVSLSFFIRDFYIFKKSMNSEQQNSEISNNASAAIVDKQ